MRLLPALALPAFLLLASCSSGGPSISLPGSSGARPPADVPLFGPGFRAEGDLCRRAGESGFTNQFLSDTADLVACPPGTDPRLFTHETGGTEVARRGGWIRFTVPHR